MKLLFICFLFVFCPPHHYRPHKPVAVETPFCKGIVAAFAKSNTENKDKFVSAFPADKQDQARACLE